MVLQRLCLCLVCATVLNGCAGPTSSIKPLNAALTETEKLYQQQLHVERIFTYQKRLDRLSAPLLQAAVPFCPSHIQAYTGLYTDNTYNWDEKYRTVARRIFALDNAVKIVHLIPDSPAEKAGLLIGDIITDVNGRSTIAGQGAVRDFNNMLREEAHINLRPVEIGVFRDGKRLRLAISPNEACRYSVSVIMSNSINAYADGDSVYITSGLIRFTETDAELAAVIGHEIAHNLKHHIDAKRHNRTIGSVFDVFSMVYGVNTQGLFSAAMMSSYSKSFEREADYIGMYIAARAKYNLEGVSSLWRRMSSEDSSANENSIFRSHPINAERAKALDLVVDEINLKIAAGDPLLPDENFKSPPERAP